MTSATFSDDPQAIRDHVREHYGKVAEAKLPQGCCAPSSAPAPAPAQGCCGPGVAAHDASLALGYGEGDLEAAPEDANLGLGCGNPTALAGLREGEVVLDLGSGGGLDAFIAARAVGEGGRVIGVDMTPEMLRLARRNAVKADLEGRVEFREGVIEDLPVVDSSVDVVLSNCVINLSPDKGAVFREAFRVLRPGGRLAVSDIVLERALPPAVAQNAGAWSACIAGAEVADVYLGRIESAGFADVRWTRTPVAPMLEGMADDPLLQAAKKAFGEAAIQAMVATVWSYRIEARKPETDAA